MDARNRFLIDKLRFAKRITTKREFNFIPIKHGLPESKDDALPTENEQTFGLSPPKWASSPRDTPGESQKKKKRLVDISLIEPISGLRISGPKLENEERTINLAALRVAGQMINPQGMEEALAPKSQVEKDLKMKEKDEQEFEAASSQVQVSQKKPNSRVKETETHSDSAVSKMKSGVPKAISDRESEGSGWKIRRSLRKRSNSGPSKISKSHSSRSGSESSQMRESEKDVPKTLKNYLYKNSREAKESGVFASAVSSSRIKQSKNRDEIEMVLEEKISHVRKRSQSRSGKSTESGNSLDEEILRPIAKRASKKSSDSEKKSADEDVKKSDQMFGKSTESVPASVQRKRDMSSDSEKSVEGVPPKIRKSSESGKSSGKELLEVKKSGSSEKSLGGSLSSQENRIRRSSSSEKFPAVVPTAQKETSKKLTRRSSSSEKSTVGVSKVQKKPTRSSSSEKSAVGVSKVQKKPTRSSSSEKSAVGVSTAQRKPARRSSSSEKSAIKVSTAKKKTRRSSSSARSTAGVSTAQRKRRSSSPEKSDAQVSKVQKKTRSSNSENSTGFSTPHEKHPKISNSPAKTIEAVSLKTKKSINNEDFPMKVLPSTSRLINPESQTFAGEGPSESQMLYSIFTKDSRRPLTSRYGASVNENSSSEEKLFSTQKQKIPKVQISTKKGAKFKKSVKSKPKRIGARSSGDSPSTDEQLFSPQKKVPIHHILSPTCQPRKSGKKVDHSKLGKNQLKSFSAKQSKFQNQQLYRISNSESESEEAPVSGKSLNIMQLKKGSLKRRLENVSEEISEEIPLQNKPAITTFAGLLLSDGEKYSSDENSEAEKYALCEDSILELENVLDSNRGKFNKIFDISRDLKLKLLQPSANISSRSRRVSSITDLDVMWSFLKKSLDTFIKETEDEEKSNCYKIMRSYLENYLNNAITERLKQKSMQETLRGKEKKIKLLTDKLLSIKQKNRLIVQRLYEREKRKPPQNDDGDIFSKYEECCRSFAKLKRSYFL